jgi:hypothetical protein
VRVVARYAECLAELVALEVVPDHQLDDLAVTRVHPDQGVMHELLQFYSFGGRADGGRFIGHVRHLIKPGRGLLSAQPAVALVACDRV